LLRKFNGLPLTLGAAYTDPTLSDLHRYGLLLGLLLAAVVAILIVVVLTNPSGASPTP
jgi:tetrahydromethanopterin S-methyltransferase subunit B